LVPDTEWDIESLQAFSVLSLISLVVSGKSADCRSDAKISIKNIH
jgi:hypothetical protein